MKGDRQTCKVVVTSLTLTVGACTMNETQQRVGSGAVLGATLLVRQVAIENDAG